MKLLFNAVILNFELHDMYLFQFLLLGDIFDFLTMPINISDCLSSQSLPHTVRVNISVGGDATNEKDNMQALESELASLQDLSFAFKRAVSRLMEMVSEEYYAKWKEMYSVTPPSQSPSPSSSSSVDAGNGASVEVETNERI